MKRPILYFTLFTILVASSCKKPDEPIDVDLPSDEPLELNDTLYSDTTYKQQRLLAEEFTGHTCQSCPEGSDMMNNLNNKYPKDMIVVRVHAGSFADLYPKVGFVTDYTTKAGNYINDRRKITMYPSAAFNRWEGSLGQPITKHLLREVWADTMNHYLQTPEHSDPPLQLILRNIRNDVKDENNLQVTAHALKATNKNYDLVIYVTEDQLYSDQIDFRLELQNLDPHIKNYHHSKVLRGTIGSYTGIPFITQNLNKGDRTSQSFNYFSVDRESYWNVKNLRFVAFVVDQATGVVVQAESVPFTQ